MGLGDFLFGSDPKVEKLPLLNKGQERLLNRATGGLARQGMPQFLDQTQGYNQGLNYLLNLYNQSPDAFDKFKAPYMRQFQQEVVPGIAERFSSMGAGSRNSSAFNQAMARAGEGLSGTLASQMEGLKSNLLSQLLGFSSAPMSQYQNLLNGLLGVRSFENIYQPGTQGMVAPMMGGLASGIGMALGGPLGGALGGSLGSMMSGAMGGGGLGTAMSGGGSGLGSSSLMGSNTGAFGLPTFMGR